MHAAESLAAHQILAQASPPATTEAAPAPAETDAAVEARIKELHNKLHITAAQQTQWDNLVQVMRDNAKAMIDLQKQRAKDVKSMTAVDAVKSYAAVIEAHEAGMTKFVPAFEALYNHVGRPEENCRFHVPKPSAYLGEKRKQVTENRVRGTRTLVRLYAGRSGSWRVTMQKTTLIKITRIAIAIAFSFVICSGLTPVRTASSLQNI